ncbi:DNA polymerase III subunit delta' [Neisseria lisongii]|uniref:DNA polymerase III subunit delta n=1 Tax=Neisseria lisongii TaxID=2912188 RepID=A0AAW5AS29_9NEIS|nr:DNA polymerase III subunit delta' [Neisseria lisongii]MCF7530198.1 DNA polymerase III subunit delta' [Neisseria lisongii]
MIYPWHEQAWRQLAEHWRSRPNAWLIAGRENTGKTAFARHLAQALLCESPDSRHQACGHCPSCHLFAQGGHPDFYELAPEAAEGETAARKLQQIKIDAVRDVVDKLYLSAVRGGLRVILIHPAESMNTQAANALLKVLEEPPQDVVFLLVCHARDKLLPTVKSRCRQLLLPAPDYAQALAFLQAQGVDNAAAKLAFHSGAPLFETDEFSDGLRAGLLDLLAQPRLLAILDYAAEFDKHKQPLAAGIDWLQKWLLDVGLAQQNMPPLYYPDYADAGRQVAGRTRPDKLFRLMDTLNKLAPYGRHTLNVRMQMESLLIDYLAFWQNK